MKKIFTFLFMGFAATMLFAQQPLNASFEKWSEADVGELPDGWDGTNIDQYGITAECVTKDNVSPQEGTYSAKLESKVINVGQDVLLPGLITLGTLDLINQSLTGGMPYTRRPEQFIGYYKFAPVNGDTANIKIIFISDGDTICKDDFQVTATTSTWTQFTIDLSYTSDVAPDTMNIICVSSVGNNTNHEGSTLNLDNFELTGGNVSVSDYLLSSKISITPNPANDFVNIRVNNVGNNAKITLHNTVGQVVYSKTYNNSSNINDKIDISKFNSGIYFVEIINDGKSSIEKLVVK